MRIVIDMQGAQASNSSRGIGRYTLALAKAIIKQRGNNEVHIALNGSFGASIDSLRSIFSETLAQNCIHVWNLEYSANGAIAEDVNRIRSAELIREAFLYKLNPDLILNISLFEGFGDNAVTSVGLFSSTIPNAILLHDLIPIIRRDVYLANPVFESWYLRKLDNLRRADLLLTNSLSTAKEAIDVLGFCPEEVVNVSSACDDHFKRIKITDGHKIHLKNRFKINQPLVMYTGGIDFRKNIEGLIRAYANLPMSVRDKHQLAIVCSIQDIDRSRLEQLGAKVGLQPSELIITGFVNEDDLVLLYNACILFVFPSIHEGFGLPALEAMACGKAVIGANTSSIPEVIGRADALFDPFNDVEITDKILQVLTNKKFREELEKNAVLQLKKFSWDDTGKRAWSGMSGLIAKREKVKSSALMHKMRRQKLAFLSPLIPQKSGISDYSAELLPELARHYEIDIISDFSGITDKWVLANGPVKSISWFKENFSKFDRVLYHFGNSEFHSHMFDLLENYPGVVVLHDFFLSGIVAYMEVNGGNSNGWAQALLNGHGWSAVKARFTVNDTAEVVYSYPSNIEVLQNSLGILVHSESSKLLAIKWFGVDAVKNWNVVPLLRTPPFVASKASARISLDLKEKQLVICSFGALGRTKLNQELFDCWLNSELFKDLSCILVFVGEVASGLYGENLVESIKRSNVGDRVRITGWTDAATYRMWLEAADVGVQLRTLSRGETSAAVLDCMNFGIATIVNANGAMSELPSTAVVIIPDAFSSKELISALNFIGRDKAQRKNIGHQAKNWTKTNNNPRVCADLYTQFIEKTYDRSNNHVYGLLDCLTTQIPNLSQHEAEVISLSVASNFPPSPRKKKIFLDISELVQRDAKSGIQRVVRSLLNELLVNFPNDTVVEPIYATDNTIGYKYARKFTSKFLNISNAWAEDEPVEAFDGDLFLGLDLQPTVVPAQIKTLLKWHRSGTKVKFVVYDLIPVLMPHVFPEAARAGHQKWLETIALFDGAICISKSVACELEDWLNHYPPERGQKFDISWFHLGADVENSVPTKGLPKTSSAVFAAIALRPSFVTVGTIEPRKGHNQLILAFEKNWENGVDSNLIIVGKQGWLVESLIEKIQNHKEFNRRLFWLDSISDEYLELIYSKCSCLVAASEGEGFGLPLIEAAQHKLPIIARDISVFREVAGKHAQYFNDSTDPLVISEAISSWLNSFVNMSHIESKSMPWLTWSASASQLVRGINGESKVMDWYKDGSLRYWGSDYRMNTQVGRRFGKSMQTTEKTGFLVCGPTVALSRGKYTIQLFGLANILNDSDYIEIVSEKDTKKHLQVFLSNVGADIFHALHAFNLDVDAEGVEFRIFVDALSEISLSDVVVRKLIN